MSGIERIAQSMEEKYGMPFENMREGFCAIDIIFNDEGTAVDWRYIETNPQFINQGGSADAVGKLVSELYPEIESHWFGFYSNIALSGTPAYMEVRSVDKWYEICAFKIGGPDSRRVGTLFRDITERKGVEEKLRKSEERFRTVQENSLDRFTILSPLYDEQGEIIDFIYVYQNAQAAKVIGCSPEELVGLRMTEVWPAFPKTRFFTMYKQAVETKLITEFEELYNADGICDWFRATVTPIPDGIAIETQIITERKRAEEALAFQANLLYGVHAAITAANENYILIYWNEMAERLFGWKAEEVIGRPSAEIFCTMVPGSSRSEAIGKMMKDNFYKGEVICRTKDGREIYTHVHTQVLRDDKGNFVGNVSSFCDITDRKQAEEALYNSKKRDEFLLKLSDMIRRPISDPTEVHSAVTHTVMNYFNSDRCYYCEVENDNAIIRRDASSGDLPSVAGVYPLSILPIQRSLLEAGQPFVISDVKTTDMVDEELRQLCIQLQVISFLDVPVIKDGKLAGILCIVQSTPRNWTEFEAELAVEIAERTWAAVERIKTEEALRESEERYRTLFHSMGEGFVIAEMEFDTDGKPTDYVIIDVNQAYEEHAGPSKEKVIGRRVTEVFDIVEPIWLEQYCKVVSSGEPQRIEEYSTSLNRWFNVYAFPLPTQNQFGMIFSDITKRKRAEDALRESEEKFRAVQELSPDGFTILRPVRDVSGKIIDFTWLYENAAIARLNGTDPKAVVGRRLLDLYPCHKGSNFMDAYIQAAETGGPIVFEDEYGSDSIPRPIWFRIAVVRMSGDIAVLAQDITERKNYEALLKKSIESVKRQKGYINILYETTGKILASSSPRKDIDELCGKVMRFLECQVFFNYLIEDETMMRLNAYKGVTEEKWREIEYLPLGAAVCGCVARDGCRIVAENIQVMEDPRVALVKSMGIRAYACHPLTANRKVIGTLSFGTRLKDSFSDEDLMLMNTVAESISVAMDRKLNEEKLITQAEELKATDRNKNDFLSVLSHELRNPLAAIVAGASLLDITDNKEQVSKAIEIMKRQTVQLCKLVDDLLELTRITQNKIVLQRESINLNELIHNAVNDIKLAFQKKGLQLCTKLSRNTVVLYADPVRLNQCISNYLSNALKFTPEKGTVSITLEYEKNNAIICVQDNGIGIDHKLLGQLFKPFIQADHSLDRSGNGGLGLGLSIVKSIVELHGGNVTASSPGLSMGIFDRMNEMQLWGSSAMARLIFW